MKLKHYHFEKIDSTNAAAKKYIEDEEEIVLVSADYQEKGRGRNKKQWLGNSGENALMSIGIKHDEETDYEYIAAFQGKGCLAAVRALRNLTGYEGFRLKYPNDIHAIDKGITKKICGVLVENAYRGGICSNSIIGIGINNKQIEFPGELTTAATSLSLLGFDIENETIVQNVFNEFMKVYLSPADLIISLWQEELKIEGKKVRIIDKPGEWTAKGLRPDGRLELIESGTKETSLIDNGDSIRYEIK